MTDPHQISSNGPRRGTVGIAVDNPVFRSEIARVLTVDGRYRLQFIDQSDIREGTWPSAQLAAVIATSEAIETARRKSRGDRREPCPVILVVPENALFRDRVAIARSDAFILAERIDELLPSLIALSAERLSVMPRCDDAEPLQVDHRRLLVPRLSERDRAILAALAHGSNNRAIAHRLSISPSSTKVSVRRVLDALGFRNRTDAGVFAASLNLPQFD